MTPAHAHYGLQDMKFTEEFTAQISRRHGSILYLSLNTDVGLQMLCKGCLTSHSAIANYKGLLIASYSLYMSWTGLSNHDCYRCGTIQQCGVSHPFCMPLQTEGHHTFSLCSMESMLHGICQRGEWSALLSILQLMIRQSLQVHLTRGSSSISKGLFMVTFAVWCRS